MIKFDVSGTSNSIHLNKNLGYIAVSYYDNNVVSILDYTNGNIIKEIPTIYCSASSNLLAGDDQYFIYQYAPKEIIVADAKSFEIIHTLKVDNCGAINSITLEKDKLLVTANKAIGKQEKYSNIFLFNLSEKTVTAYTDGKKYIKNAYMKNGHIICFHNGLNTHNFLSISLNGEIKDNIIGDSLADNFNIILSNDSSLYFVATVTTGEYQENKIYEISPINGSLYPVENKFFKLQVQTGFINKIGKSYILGYDEMIKKYCLSATKHFSSKTGNTILGASVITEAIAVDDQYFAFGADHVIYVIEV